MTTSEYVLGTDQQELIRLGIQHQLWTDAAHQLWKRANITPGKRILDIGCGPGYASRDLARLVGPTGFVMGVDESEPYIAECQRFADATQMTWLDARQGDVHDLANLLHDQSPFDLAYARWVFTFLHEPARVVEGLAATLAPGARVCISDYFNYEHMALAPRDPAFHTAVAAIARAIRDRLGNPDVMGILPTLLNAAGFEVNHIEVDQRLARPGDAMWTWPDTFWPSVIPRLVASAHLTQAQADAFFDSWQRVSKDPDVFFLLPTVFHLVATRR